MSTSARDHFQQMVSKVEALGDIDQAITKGVRQRNRMITTATAVGVAAVVVLAAILVSNPLKSATPEPLQPGPTVDRTTTIAKGEGVALVGASGLGNQTLSVSAKEQNNLVTGEFLISANVIRIDCADTNHDGLVILGGEATEGYDVTRGDLFALIIREGDPDSVALYGNDTGAGSCDQLIDSITDRSLKDDTNFVDVEDGYDIVTD